jgi:DNA-directed RNA polymerase subunit M/transcription elongation factor TFIIS
MEDTRARVCAFFKTVTRGEIPDGVIGNLERAVFNYAVQYAAEKGMMRSWDTPLLRGVYHNKAMSVAVNLDPEGYVGNVSTLARLKRQDITPHDVAFMKPEAHMPAKWEPIVSAKMKTDKYAYEVTYVPNASEITCFKCKKNQVYFYEIQSRSADEPTSLICTCLNCGNRWRMN